MAISRKPRSKGMFGFLMERYMPGSMAPSSISAGVGQAPPVDSTGAMNPSHPGFNEGRVVPGQAGPQPGLEGQAPPLVPTSPTPSAPAPKLGLPPPGPKVDPLGQVTEQDKDMANQLGIPLAQYLSQYKNKKGIL